MRLIKNFMININDVPIILPDSGFVKRKNRYLAGKAPGIGFFVISGCRVEKNMIQYSV